MIMRGGGKKNLESFYPTTSGNQTQTVKVSQHRQLRTLFPSQRRPYPLRSPLPCPSPHLSTPLTLLSVQVESVYRRRMSVYLARIEKSKKNGSTSPIPVHASNLMLKKVRQLTSACVVVLPRCQSCVVI